MCRVHTNADNVVISIPSMSSLPITIVRRYCRRIYFVRIASSSSNNHLISREAHFLYNTLARLVFAVLTIA